ncbi:hypothetical protein ANN_17790 [Periplaneta americana]|uniref:HAT C-terminal dimerisation domain-containing protein n=1 Tax=Periplaneta americana TaxID=6978 RepID=A0ABQ8SV93_PERAM|nr:hypothetical protein ANN_17790 [Periplaneta americana]
MTDFVACAYDNLWWMGCILSMDVVDCEVTISFLHPAGSATYFSYPWKPDEEHHFRMKSRDSPSDISCFKFALITSVEVERSFSTTKNVLSDTLTMSIDNLKKHLVVACKQGKSAAVHECLFTYIYIRNIKSRRLRWAGHVARMGESRNAYSVLVGRPKGKRPLRRPRRRWEDNIKTDLSDVRYDDREWINLAQDKDQWRAYVRAAMNLRVP